MQYVDIETGFLCVSLHADTVRPLSTELLKFSKKSGTQQWKIAEITSV